MIDHSADKTGGRGLSAEERPRPASRYWRVALIEDHLLMRKRTEELLSSQHDLRIMYSGETLPEFVRWVRTVDHRLRPDLLVLDLMVDRGPGVDPAVVRTLVTSGVRVMVLSALASAPLVRSVIQAGAAGIVGKRDSEEDILAAVRAVLGDGQWMTQELAAIIAGDANRPRLSDQEERALVLYGSGLTLPAVAKALGVKPGTAKKYLDRVKDKYSAVGRPLRSKVDFAGVAVSDGYLESSDESRV